ncbi:MAG: ferritin [Methylacidiphilales bacterium]|nr:ferritin [Candidatus Methylacidiphilales bacterium]MDW8350137.1 ferritin [Verrucomicrobiae bacterium]
MLTSSQVLDLLNQQIGNEFSASLQYTAIAAHFEAEALPELAAFFYKQSDEERGHAYKFLKYVIDVGGRAAIPAIPAPICQFQFAEQAIALSLQREKEVTQQIHHILRVAISESDYTTQNFLQWFIEEQLEEVATMDHLLKVVQRAGEGGLLHVEQYLARKNQENQHDKD